MPRPEKGKVAQRNDHFSVFAKTAVRSKNIWPQTEHKKRERANIPPTTKQREHTNNTTTARQANKRDPPPPQDREKGATLAQTRKVQRSTAK